MVKFCKDGSDAVSGALKLARASPAATWSPICGNHPFFSVDDWFIGVTAMPAVCRQSTRALTLKFNYNDLAEPRKVFDEHPGRIAAIVLEAEKKRRRRPDSSMACGHCATDTVRCSFSTK